MIDPARLDAQKLTDFGTTFRSMFETYRKDRKALEDRWLRDMRQFRGIYDPEVKLPKDSTNAYPKLTRRYVIGTVARLMEMLFPQTEKNWGVDASPIPDLSQADTQTVLTQLQAEGKLDDSLSPDQASEVIEKAVKMFARVKAGRMSKVIEDQLAEMDYVSLATRVVFSGALYGTGLLEGPSIKTQKTRVWRIDPITRRHVAVENSKRVPFYENVSIWEWYPDLSARTVESQDGYFLRRVMSRAQLRKLADREDFIQANVLEWLKTHDSGNYKPEDWEIELQSRGDKKNVEGLKGRKYEVIQWWGTVSGHYLRAAGVTVSDAEVSDEFEANVWLLDSVVIKAVINPLATRRRPLHIFIYEEDDVNLAGVGVAHIVRDTQLTICDATRMLINNCSVVSGVQLLIRTYLLQPNQSYDIHANKIWYQDEEDVSSPGLPAVENININGHIEELLAVIRAFTELGDQEVSLPPPALGDPTKGGSEALRTMGTASMLFGAAALPIRNTVRGFDRFTLSFVQSLIDWNMQFNTDESIKGDFQPIARGSTSLIAKEVRAQSLDYLATTLQPEERVFLKGREFLVARMRARDLDVDELLEDQEVVDEKLRANDAMTQEQMDQQRELAAAQVRELLASALEKVSKADAQGAQVTVDVFNALLEALNGEEEQQGGTEKRAVPEEA